MKLVVTFVLLLTLSGCLGTHNDYAYHKDMYDKLAKWGCLEGLNRTKDKFESKDELLGVYYFCMSLDSAAVLGDPTK